MFNRILSGKILLLLIIVIVSGITVLGCAPTGAQPKGWSGGTIADGTLFLGSMEGKVAAVNISTHVRLWPDVLLETKPAGGGLSGGLSCTPTSTRVAIYGTPAVAGGLVYVSGYNGKVYAFSSSSGTLRWVYPRQGNLQPIIGGPIVSQGKVYFGCSDGKVYALDAANGDWIWEFPTGDKIWSTPTIDGGTLYISSFDKKIYALDVTTGKKKWEFETQGAITSTPLVYNNTIYTGSFDRYLYAVDATDGSLIWKSKAEADSWFWANPVICNNTVHAPCLDGKIYILNAGSGDIINTIDLGSPICSSPVLVDDLLIIASEEGVIYAIDTRSFQKSELKNLGEKIYASLCASDETVYIHTQKHETLYALNAQTGVVLWSLPLTSK